MQGAFDQVYEEEGSDDVRRDLNRDSGGADLHRSMRVNNNRSGLHNIAKHFPFSNLINREGGDCVFCLEEFKELDANGKPYAYIQLKCSKFHIFH
jgi:hypothetical protein